MALKREDQFLLHAGVNGVSLPSVYSWSEMDDGGVTAAGVKVWPGMINQIPLGGPASRADATIKRPYSTALAPYMVQLENVVGRAGMWMSWTPLDANGNPDGPTETIGGILIGCPPPARNAAGTNATYLTLVMSAFTVASIGQ